MTTSERISAARAALTVAEADFAQARRAYYLAQAALYEAQGDAFVAKWHRAIAECDHDTADRCYLEDQARKVLAGQEPYGDISETTRARIMAEVERLRAEEAPRSHVTTVLADDGVTEVEVEPQH